MTMPLLTISDLTLQFSTPRGSAVGLSDLSLTVERGEKLGIVGESGSGKTTAAMAVLGLLPSSALVTGGSILINGEDIVHTSERRLRQVRGTVVSAVFQNARAALNPIMRIGEQIADAILSHRKMKRQEALERAVELLESVHFSDPIKQARAYPHQLSGGMCQRAMIAMAIACEPQLLIADEPTTGLDVTTQKAVMKLLNEIVVERGMALILITHDLALAGNYCDRIAVMRHGKVVEAGSTQEIFSAPSHAYTRTLIEATPKLLVVEAAIARAETPLLRVQDLGKDFSGRTAVGDVSFAVGQNESVGLVGESGSGKSTIARLVARLADPTAGKIDFGGADIGTIPARDFHRSPYRAGIQLVFQDPTDSLPPHMSVFATIADPMRRLKGLKGEALRERVEKLADQVQLPRALLTRLPHQLSGGQKARVGIARAIAVEPLLLILDEPTASLDVSIQASILGLLAELRRDLEMSYLFISHDLNVVSNICDRTIVLKGGMIVEEADSPTIFARPKHPYTRQLLDAVLQPPQPAEDPRKTLARY
ncbi:ABC transporter ATP-binding protein [Agrobacterium rhizogenes]|uniref:ABC transporter ATP-binding protein n=1 Tax=Rhizobium rhizogenes (strain K84 / ATCC BAA-868) TaxID=311403 RepID=B9JQG1_RHIR8|nr:ABC transporter ATP-binding protein [Rhizobium rhizogenes]ACM31380.1 ABC transporter ATP-binding protein [Rhizobium rhizogenes K84]OCJ22497.1 ABC transporter ATP-binding protein [Agrobacterium sp. B131/95]OCJ28513.1 ABC transporter ATP-binding protein [Agrobacterium sp. B133/95]NTI46322.1 ABC transporter ATP-binding protein [Rhizobium rhizogenes]NTI53006.1 ABC transporter ATP-binding protein [Rhizobium rhizogenes]